MGDVIDFKSRKVIQKHNNVHFLNRNGLFKIYFTCPDASIHMDRNESNMDIALEMWTEEVDGVRKKLGVAVVPGNDESTAIYRLNTLIAFASIDQVDKVD